MIKILKSDLTKVYDRISNDMELYLPIKNAGQVNYGLYEQGAEVSVETLKTVKSAKDHFFPQSEDMMRFKTEGKKIDIIDIREEVKPFVIFGVKACDYRSFEILDKVFLQEPVDTYYKAKRDAAIIVTLACAKPEESCFCSLFNIDASNPKGDVTSWMDSEYAYLVANTQKGQALLDSVKDLGVEGGEQEVKAQQEQIKQITEQLPFVNLDLSRFKPENLNDLFNDERWAKLSEACLGCGTCTFVCPTCQCFDIRDFKTNEGVIRFRCWDSCMYQDFTQMAAENSRKTQMQRYRQRFMHKLCYFLAQYGEYSCVGCGRCVNKCPQHLNIVKVIKALGGK